MRVTETYMAYSRHFTGCIGKFIPFVIKGEPGKLKNCSRKKLDCFFFKKAVKLRLINAILLIMFKLSAITLLKSLVSTKIVNFCNNPLMHMSYVQT